MHCPTVFAVLIALPLSLGRHVQLISTKENKKNETKDSKEWSPRLYMTEEGVLECRAGGSPPPLIHWLKDGHPIQQVNEGLSNGVGSTSSRLYLDCPSLGVYECVSENSRGNATARHAITSSSNSQCIPSRIEVPRIVLWSRTLLETQGADVRLLCRAQATHRPAFHWYNPKEEPIQDGSKYEILSNGDLLIREVAWQDMGSYVCEAKNEQGSDKAEVFLYPATPDK